MKQLIFSIFLLLMTTSVLATIDDSILWYTTDELSGDMIDQTVNGYDATTVNLNRVSGKFGGGIQSTGATSEWGVDVPTFLLSTTQDFSLAFWYKRDTLPGAGTVTYFGPYYGGQEPPPAGGYCFDTNIYMGEHETQISFARGTQCVCAEPVFADVSLDTWYHMVFVYDGDTQTQYLYQDGVLVDSQSDSCAGNSPSTTMLGMDSFADNVRNFDEIRFYDRELSSSDVNELFFYIPPEAPPASCDVHQLNILSQNTYGILNGTNYYVPAPGINNMWFIFDRVINDTCDIEFSPDNITWTTIPGEHYWDISEWCGTTNMVFPEGTHYLRGHGYPNDGGAQLESCSYYFEPFPVEEPVVEIEKERDNNNNNAFFINQNLAKQAESTQKPTLIQAISQVILNIRSAILGIFGMR